MALTQAEELRLLQLEEAEKNSNPEGKGFVAGLGRGAVNMMNSLGRALPDSVRQSMEQKGYLPTERDKQSIQQLPSDFGSSAGELAFEGAATAVPGGAAAKLAHGATKMVPVIRHLAPAAAGGAGGLAGAEVMGADPVEGAIGGAILGPAMSLTGWGLRKPVESVADWLGGARDRANKELRQLFGDRAKEAADALRNVTGFVAGEQPTVATAATPRLSELKALEDMARNSPENYRLLERDAANKAARLRAVEQHAEPGYRTVEAGPNNPTSTSPLEKARTARTDPLYAAANNDVVATTPSLRATLEGAQVRVPRAKADATMSQRRSNMQAQGNTPPPRAGNIPGSRVPRAARIEELQATKNELTKSIKALENSSDAATVAQRNNLIEARRMLDAEMRAQSPNYAAASDAWAQEMIPQNQADVAGYLTSALSSSNEAETAAKFLRAMDDAPRTIKNSIGKSRFDRLEQVASPRQMADYGNVKESLLREERVRQLGPMGGTVPKYEGPMDAVARMAPPIFDQTITMARRAVQNLAKKQDAEVMQILNEAMVDPKAMADLISKTAMVDRPTLKMYLDVVKSFGRPEAIGVVSGTVGGNE